MLSGEICPFFYGLVLAAESKKYEKRGFRITGFKNVDEIISIARKNGRVKAIRTSRKRQVNGYEMVLLTRFN